MIKHTMGLREWATLITLSVCWGGSFFFADVALEDLPPFTLVVLRVGIAAVILNIVMMFAGQSLWNDRWVWPAFFAMGVLNNVIPFCLIVWGQTQIASGLAAILNATTPFFTVVLAHLLTGDEKLTINRMAGVLTGLIGVTVIIGPAVLGGLGANALAQMAVLGAAISYGFAGIFGRRFARLAVSPLTTATGQLTASTVVLMPVALFIDQPWALPMPGWQTWGAILGIATLSTAFGYILFFRLLAVVGATNLLLVTFLIPVSAILMGSLVLGEVLEAKHYAGMAVIFAGLLLIDGRVLNALMRGRKS